MSRAAKTHRAPTGRDGRISQNLYHTERPHQGKDNDCLNPSIVRPQAGEIKRREVIGGLINQYYRDAA